MSVQTSIPLLCLVAVCGLVILLIKLMTALETLTASVNANTAADADLTVAVNAAIVQLGKASPTDAQLLTLSSQVDANTATTAAQTKAINDALTPVIPPPAP